jgi:hypothetical protein
MIILIQIIKIVIFYNSVLIIRLYSIYYQNKKILGQNKILNFNKKVIVQNAINIYRAIKIRN